MFPLTASLAMTTKDSITCISFLLRTCTKSECVTWGFCQGVFLEFDNTFYPLQWKDWNVKPDLNSVEARNRKLQYVTVGRGSFHVSPQAAERRGTPLAGRLSFCYSSLEHHGSVTWIVAMQLSSIVFCVYYELACNIASWLSFFISLS